MPIYEYHCGKCGDFEVMQKMSDKPLSTCPTCRRKVNKLISSTSFQLKGSGWYVTDYARKGGSGGAASEKSKSEKKDDTGDGGGKSSSDSKASGESSGSAEPSGGAEPSKPSGTKKAGKASEKAAAA